MEYLTATRANDPAGWRRNDESARSSLWRSRRVQCPVSILRKLNIRLKLVPAVSARRWRKLCGFSAINDWVEDIGHGQTAISVKVKHPEVEHTVRVQDFERWLEASPRSPAEMTFKNRLRELLAKGT